GVELTAIQARDFRPDQRGAVLEIFRNIIRPLLKLAVVGGQGLPAFSPLRTGRPVAQRGQGERDVEMIVSPLEYDRRNPEEPVCFVRRGEGGGIVASQGPGLQLADPIQDARLLFRTALEPFFIEPVLVEAAECRGQAPEGPDQPELCGDEVDDVKKPSATRELDSELSLALRFGERIAASEKMREEIVAADR